MIGRHIGRYAVRDTIGSGGMGLVVRAHDPELGRDVAIKVVRPHVLSPERSQAARARLLAEARALARVAHPNVVAIYEVGVHDGMVFVAMELVDGVDLEQWLRSERRPVAQILAAFIAAAHGVAAMHAAGLVHRDVKPANILMGRDGRVRVADLGIARASAESTPPEQVGDGWLGEGVELDTTALTAEGRVVGTPAYMAPEQHLGTDVGPAADQFGLCAALFEALWGRRPFEVDARRLLAAKRIGPTVPPEPRVPRWLAAIVLRGLAAAPADRFASMVELGAALAGERSRRRRRVAAVGAAIGAVALGLAVAARTGPCADDGRALAGVWDPPTRATVERAFAASPRPWAPPAWAQVRTRLDAYADEWSSMRLDACEATRVRSEQSPDVLDRRMACLDSRRRALAATTQLFATGEDVVVDHAFELLARLRKIGPCGDQHALAAAIAPPDEPTLVAEVESVRTEIARGRALFDAARHAEARELARGAVASARQLDYPPLLAEALAFEGEALLRVGPVAEAGSDLESALWTAIAAGDDETAADAAIGLVWIAGQYQRSLPDALRWAEIATASATRTGDQAQLSQIDNALGAAQLHAAHYDAALASFERALARIGDDPDAVPRTAALRHNIAKGWFDRGDLARARAVLEPTIVELAEVLGDEHPRVVAMRGTLGQILGAGGDHARAAELFTSEIEGLRLAMGDDALAVAHARTNLGVTLGRLGRTDEAIAVTEQALAAFERAGDDGGAATCLGNIADDLLGQGIHDAAAARFQRALELLEKMYPQGHPDLVYPLVGLGRVRMAQHRFADALATYERAEAQLAATPDASGHTRGLALEGRGQALVALGRDREAGSVLAELVRITRAAGDSSPEELPIALLQQAEVLDRLGEFDDGQRAAEEAVALADAQGLDGLRDAAARERDRAREGSKRARTRP